ncbi:MAG: AAA family ATPase [Bacteroidota bacterium]
MKIYIFGASGSGVTTLGQTLSKQLAYPYYDADDFYWIKTDPPFEQKVPFLERQKNAIEALCQHKNWVFGGSIVSWGDIIYDQFNLAVFLYVPTQIRMNRLQQREIDRYGPKVNNEPTKSKSTAFLEWASHYDDPPESGWMGRSLFLHRQWMTKLSCPILDISGEQTVDQRLQIIADHLALRT